MEPKSDDINPHLGAITARSEITNLLYRLNTERDVPLNDLLVGLELAKIDVLKGIESCHRGSPSMFGKGPLQT